MQPLKRNRLDRPLNPLDKISHLEEVPHVAIASRKGLRQRRDFALCDRRLSICEGWCHHYYVSLCERWHVSPRNAPLRPWKCQINMPHVLHFSMSSSYRHVMMTSVAMWIHRDQWYSTTWPPGGERKGPAQPFFCSAILFKWFSAPPNALHYIRTSPLCNLFNPGPIQNRQSSILQDLWCCGKSNIWDLPTTYKPIDYSQGPLIFAKPMCHSLGPVDFLFAISTIGQSQISFSSPIVVLEKPCLWFVMSLTLSHFSFVF